MAKDYKYATDGHVTILEDFITTKLGNEVVTVSGNISEQLSEYSLIHHTHDFNALPPRKFIHLTGASGIPCDNETKFTWDTEIQKDYDYFSFNESTGEVTVLSGGLYRISYSMNYENSEMDPSEVGAAVAINTCDAIVDRSKSYGFSPSSMYPHVDIERKLFYDLSANDKIILRDIGLLTGGASSDWYDVEFPRRKKITIDSSYVVCDANTIVALDPDVSYGGGTTHSLLYSLPDYDDRILIVGVINEDPNPVATLTSCTFNGNNMTLVASSTGDNGSYHNFAYLYYMLEDDLPSSPGSYNVVITSDKDNNDLNIGVFTIYNAKQQAPSSININNNTGSSTINTSITTTENNSIIVDVVACGDPSTLVEDSGQNLQVSNAGGSSSIAMSSKSLSTVGTTSMGWSNGGNRLAHVVAAFEPTAGQLLNFPTYINLDGLSGSSDGVAFADTSKNLLDFEIESFDGVEIHAWVKIPVLSCENDFEFYIYYDNPSGMGYDNPIAVWDSNYMGVWHLSDDLNDSTSYNNDAINNGTISTAGQLSDARDFNRSAGQYITVSDSASLEMSDVGQVTVEAWINKKSTPGGWMAVVQKSDVSYNLQLENSTTPHFTIYDTTWNSADADSSISNGVWYYIVGTFDGSTITVYLNGAPQSATGTASSINSTSVDVGIGENLDATGRYFDGVIDEVRISDIARSASWIETTYNNQNSPSTFYTVEPEESLRSPFNILGDQCIFKVEFVR